LHLPPLDRVLPARADSIYRAIAPRIDTGVAMETVRAIAPLWRIAGNPSYDRSIDLIADRLARGGFARVEAPAAAPGAASWIESYTGAGQGWSEELGTVAIDREPRETVLSRERDRVALCINSFSTPKGGSVLPLVDVGAGAASDFEGKEVTGAVVLGDTAVGPLWTRAVRDRGAAGVISTDLAAYTRPDETPDVLQWGSIPYDAERRSFGFKASRRASRQLRAALHAGPVRLHIEIATTFHRGASRTLIAEIPGRSRREERVVLVAHVQEPGANDNASGTGTLLAAALATRAAIDARAIPPPQRTLTFMWLDENRGSEQWIKQDAERAKNVLAMMSLDMTGEDTTKTGGTFLIEKSPDPSALWERPSDPHSEWGSSQVDRALVRGHLLNDLHLAVALRRARDTGWTVRTNPYEGGSDHTIFTRAGVPALLNWHFTDRYYHTNLDTVDKVSPVEMGHVATIVATTATFLAAADGSDAADLDRLIADAERARLATEQANGASREIIDAWNTWYAEARASIQRVAR
jgi:hypothetical protein